jgi:hypothetical protein
MIRPERTMNQVFFGGGGEVFFGIYYFLLCFKILCKKFSEGFENNTNSQPVD